MADRIQYLVVAYRSILYPKPRTKSRYWGNPHYTPNRPYRYKKKRPQPKLRPAFLTVRVNFGSEQHNRQERLPKAVRLCTRHQLAPYLYTTGVPIHRTCRISLIGSTLEDKPECWGVCETQTVRAGTGLASRYCVNSKSLRRDRQRRLKLYCTRVAPGTVTNRYLSIIIFIVRLKLPAVRR
jgi:hypothetical protein